MLNPGLLASLERVGVEAVDEIRKLGAHFLLN
jgi:hypothetical protein